jgi:predicted lactoylglutathione lyase
MYSRAFEDLDGHTWEIAFMDMDAQPEGGTGA